MAAGALVAGLCACPASPEPTATKPLPSHTARAKQTARAKPSAREAQPPTPSGRGQAAKELVYISGSTEKLEQLIGDYDKHLRTKTRNQTKTRYRLVGTDLGSSFEYRGRLIMLFGDTLGKGGGDCMAYSTSRRPEPGLALDFFEEDGGGYLRIRPDGERMKGFEVPVGGIAIDDRAYLFCKQGYTPDGNTGRTSLVLFDEKAKTFTKIREISRRPEGKFIAIAPHHAMTNLEGLPGSGPQVLLWGTGRYRKSSSYLAAIAAADIELDGKTSYFTGLGPGSKPRWSVREEEAQPVVDHPTMGNVSVTYAAELELWLMTYDSRDPRGILLRHAAKPWGPWSEAQVIFNLKREGAMGRFVHRAGSDDGLEGPVIGKKRDDPKSVGGGAYAPYVIERFTRVEGDRLLVFYTLSTWNPYVVVLMKSALRIVR